MRVLSDQSKKAEAALTEKQEEIAANEAEIKSTEAEIEKLMAEKKALENQVEREKQNAVDKKAAFDISCQTLIDEISEDVNKFKKLKS
jgi:hypothetical protein